MAVTHHRQDHQARNVERQDGDALEADAPGLSTDQPVLPPMMPPTARASAPARTAAMPVKLGEVLPPHVPGYWPGMAVAPTPQEIYQRAEQEGRRRLFMSPLDQVATSFIAGVTIVFGIVALGVLEALVAPDLGPGAGHVAGALGFGIGVVFLVVGRTELFTENFFDPVATAIQSHGLWGRLARLWLMTLVLNLVGGAVLVALLTVEGALPGDSTATLVRIAEEITEKSWAATLARAVLAGALITLLSYMMSAVNSVVGRILVAYMVGVFLALGPFDHVVVSALHVLFGIWLSDTVSSMALATNVALSTVGNIVGGLLLITLTHTAQVKGSSS